MGASAAALAATAISPGASRADELPALVTVICGFPAGSGADVSVRFFAEKLKEATGKTVIVENRPGALTTIAAAKVAQSRPDGSVVFITGGTFSSAPPMFKKLPYDWRTDFTPVTTIFKVAFVVAVAKNSPVKDIGGLIARMKAKGDDGSFGYSSPFALGATAQFKSMAGLKTRAVAYQNSQDLQRELTSGYLDFVIQDASFTLGQISAGALRGLAVTTLERSSLLPDLPSLDEAGLKGYDLPAWFGVWLPPHAKPELVSELETTFNAIVKRDDAKAFMAKLGMEPFPGSSAALTKFQAAQIARWTEIVKLAGIEPQ